MIREAIERAVSGRDLTLEEASQVMREIMEGQATPAQLGGFLVALRLKGETADEIAGMARVMREKALRVEVAGPLVDTCGTGGDGKGTFNISTAAAFVAAGAGLRVSKHGNRAASGLCGSADVLEAAGVVIDLGPDSVRRCIEEVGIGFMFAPLYHPAMKHAAGVRREIGVRTVFNILGPLTNPAGAQSQLVGVAQPDLGGVLARVLALLGTHHALVVHGEDGADELSISGPSRVWEVKEGQVSERRVTPQEAGLELAPLAALKGGAPAENAATLRRVLGGAPGPMRGVVLLNAAAVLVAGERATTLKEGVALARQAVDSGAALAKLVGLVALSQRLA
ncbi:MAG: anthranilate phosphoribosyltransferase [Chloroflexota bacterium]|nr:anthranilate phosphoribosyltransferase [Chloroflexota bacterium]